MRLIQPARTHEEKLDEIGELCRQIVQVRKVAESEGLRLSPSGAYRFVQAYGDLHKAIPQSTQLVQDGLAAAKWADDDEPS